jgi:hypothetical protein
MLLQIRQSRLISVTDLHTQLSWHTRSQRESQEVPDGRVSLRSQPRNPGTLCFYSLANWLMKDTTRAFMRSVAWPDVCPATSCSREKLRVIPAIAPLRQFAPHVLDRDFIRSTSDINPTHSRMSAGMIRNHATTGGRSRFITRAHSDISAA